MRHSMKKVILFLNFFVFISFFVEAQTPFNDTDLLSKYFLEPADSDKIKMATDVLRKYFLNKNLTFDQMKNTIIKENHLLEDFFSPTKISSTNKRNLAASQSAIGVSMDDILNPTVLADGFAKFIATRFKEELTAAFFKKFKEKLCGSSDNDINKALSNLLPETKNIICNSDPYDYNVFLSSLRNAFERDLINTPNGIKELLADKNIIPYLKDNVRFSFITILDVITLVQRNNNIGQVLSELDDPTYITCIKNNSLPPVINGTFRITSILLRNIQNENGQYIPPNDIKNLVNNKELLQIYFGLVLLREKSNLEKINFNGENLYARLNNSGIVKKLNTLVNNIELLAAKIKEINQWTKNLKDIKTNKVKFTPDDLFQYLTFATNILKLGANSLTNLENVFEIKTNSYYKNAAEEVSEKIIVIRELVCSTLNKEWGVVIGDLMNIISNSVKENSDQGEELKEFISKYGPFIAAVLTAKNSDDIKNALESVAEPVGAWRMNRENLLNITLNSYAGGMDSFPGKKMLTGKGKVNFIASFGISISLFSRRACWMWSLLPQSIHIPIADLGPIVNLRLNNPNATLPELKWADLFSPGAYVIWNCPKLPISVGAGGQYAPQYSINSTDEVVLKNQWRWNIFLAVDIPIFGIYSIK